MFEVFREVCVSLAMLKGKTWSLNISPWNELLSSWSWQMTWYGGKSI